MDQNLSACVTTAAAILAPRKGLLAADESLGTIERRFAPLAIPSTEETRRAYRDLMFSTEGIQEYISGVIMFEETLGQRSSKGEPFPAMLQRIGVVPGIKVDRGLVPVRPGSLENLTDGLDGLAKRLATYREQGARFAKWRAALRIDGHSLPSRYTIEATAFILARYAALCQQAGIMPIVEPEVLRDGDHDLARAGEATQAVQEAIFEALYRADVCLEGMILKPNMVTAGASAAIANNPKMVADATLECLRRTVPAAVPGIAFLSGGQTPDEATANLDAMDRHADVLPWRVTFSYGRALQDEALTAWRGDAANVATAQAAFLRRCRLVSAASRGRLAAVA